MTEIRLHNTATRKKEVFEPIDPENVRMYVCGPTVYDRAHIGNARPVVVFDVLYRLLRHVYGAEHVTYVRNITDVEDKIIDRAAERGISIAELTRTTTEWFHEDMKALGVDYSGDPNFHEPRATEFVPEMVAMIERLIAAGKAYEAEGHVLFDVRAYPDYGRLSGRSVEDMIAGARVEVAPYKRDPLDFVLWKPSTGDQPGWESPWGRGRPGWHIECSAMSHALLGESFDIHGGGADLMFPHHENEVAQSKCAHPGGAFARYWLHNGMIRVEGQKMAKSLGNFITVKDVIDGYKEYGISNMGVALRWMMLETRYRNVLEFSWSALEAASVKLGKYYHFLQGTERPSEQFRHAVLRDSPFLDAVSDDLNLHEAIRILDELALTYGPLAEGGSDRGRSANEDFENDLNRRKMALAYLDLLGFSLDDLKGHYTQTKQEKLKNLRSSDDVEQKIRSLLNARADARQARDFARADAIRDGIAAAGVVVKDTPEGPVWELAPDFDPSKLEDVE